MTAKKPAAGAGGRRLVSAPVRGAIRALLPFVNWNRIYGTLSYLRSALWVVPIIAVALAIVSIKLLTLLDQWIPWDLTILEVDGARALFQTVITLTLSFMVFTFGSLLVAIQIAGGQLTPRIIATTLLRDKVIKYTVGLHVFTMLLAITALNRMTGSVFELVTVTVALLGIASLASFLFLIDYSARLLRPVRIVALVCDEGMEVVRGVYGEAFDPSQHADEADVNFGQLGPPARTVTHDGRSQVVLAADLASLVAEARRCHGVVEVLPQVGDFIAADEPLLQLYGGAAQCEDAVLKEAIALGTERTMEQDPMFAFRILVDVALKALSPAINDPTTAVLAMDQIHRLLRFVGKRQLHGQGVRDDAGELRVVFRTPDWDNFVDIAFTEIRACGGNSVQIVRRMRAMLENLLRSLPATRHAALHRQLDLLERTLPGLYPLEEDLALARIPDSQGLGGASGGSPGASR